VRILEEYIRPAEEEAEEEDAQEEEVIVD